MIEKKNFKKIEYHLYNFHNLLNELQEDKEEILLGSPLPPDGMPRGTGTSDPTGARAVKILSLKTEINRKWVESINELIEEYKQEGMTHYVNFIRLMYWERRSRIQILLELCIERATLYNWRNTIVMDLSLKASTKGLVKF